MMGVVQNQGAVVTLLSGLLEAVKPETRVDSYQPPPAVVQPIQTATTDLARMMKLTETWGTDDVRYWATTVARLSPDGASMFAIKFNSGVDLVFLAQIVLIAANAGTFSVDCFPDDLKSVLDSSDQRKLLTMLAHFRTPSIESV
jgi:hypothetical protein